MTLADLAARGVHPPERTPFTYPWTDAPADEFALKFAQYHWRTRADFGPDAWVLNLGVWHEGDLVGVQGINTTKYLVTRTGETGPGWGSSTTATGSGPRCDG